MRFTQEDENVLRLAYQSWPPDIRSLEQKLGRKKNGIILKARKMGLTRNTSLTKQEKNYIRQHYKSKRVHDLIHDLNRNRATICKFMRQEGLNCIKYCANKWMPTKAEIEVLMASAVVPTKEISACLGRSNPTILKALRQLGIARVKPPKKIKEPKPKKDRKPRVVKPKPVDIAKPVVLPPADVPRELDGYSRIRAAMERISKI